MRHVPLVLLLALIAPIGARSAHANDVTVKVAGGTLKVKGDADGNSLSLDQAGLLATQVRVNGNNISTINGTGPFPVVFDDVTKGIQIDVGSGDDSVGLSEMNVADKVKIKMGSGDDVLFLTNNTFNDDLSVDLGADDGSLVFCGDSVTGSVALKAGPGANLGHSTSCDSTSVAANGSVLLVKDVSVGGTLAFKGSKTNEALKIVDGNVGEGAKLSLGGGTDAVALCGESFGEALKVQMGKGVTGTPTTADCGGTNVVNGESTVLLESTLVGEDFSAKFSGENGGLIVAGGGIGGNAKVDLGKGGATFTLDANVGESLAVKAGKGGDAIKLKPIQIGENATLNAGAGNNGIGVDTTTIGEDLVIKTGNGDDVITVTNPTIGGSLIVKNGKGSDTITLP